MLIADISVNSSIEKNVSGTIYILTREDIIQIHIVSVAICAYDAICMTSSCNLKYFFI